MGIMVNKNNLENNELTRRINDDLRDKMDTGMEVREGEDPDFVEDSEYVKDLNKTSKFGWMWIVLILGAILAVIIIVFL